MDALIEDRAGSQASKVLPAGKWARRRRFSVIDVLPALDLGLEQDPEGFGRVPALGLGRGQDVVGCLAQVGQAEPPGQVDHLLGLGAHWLSSPSRAHRRCRAGASGLRRCVDGAPGES